MNTKSQEIIWLKSTHFLGRDPATADTLLKNPLCSRLQCIIYFQNGAWFLTNKGKNGTFLNRQQLQSDRKKLQVGDTISFPQSEDNWSLVDASAPSPFLISRSSNTCIELKHLNLLPDEENLELLLTLEPGTGNWIVERGDNVKVIKNRDTLFFNEDIWTFYTNDIMDETQSCTDTNADKTMLTFHVSLNEENVTLQIRNGEKTSDLEHKAYHFLLLHLARRLFEDQQKGVQLQDQGWVASDVLMHELGIHANHLNILIYRARKAFDALDLTIPPIDRRQGEIRVHPCEFRVHKGQEVHHYLTHAPDCNAL